MNAVSTESSTPAKAVVNWEELGFGLTDTAFMFSTTCELDGEWTEGGVIPYGNLSLSPAAAVLNYGQARGGGARARGGGGLERGGPEFADCAFAFSHNLLFCDSPYFLITTATNSAAF